MPKDEEEAAMGRVGSKRLPGRNRGVGKHPEVGTGWQSQGTEGGRELGHCESNGRGKGLYMR